MQKCNNFSRRANNTFQLCRANRRYLHILMMVIKQEKYPEELLANEGIVYSRNDGTLGLIMRCPKCNQITTGAHIYNRETNSLTPSLRHPCGYHGYLTNGEFKDAQK